jgi:hypothetical protein
MYYERLLRGIAATKSLPRCDCVHRCELGVRAGSCPGSSGFRHFERGDPGCDSVVVGRFSGRACSGLDIRRDAARDHGDEANCPQKLQPTRRCWKLGGEDFQDWILDKMQVPSRKAHPRRERNETEPAKALRIMREELKRVGSRKAELKRLRKGDETKAAVACRLREETTVSPRWIAENLHMETRTRISNRLYHCAN